MIQYKVIGRKYIDFYTIVTAGSKRDAIIEAEGDVDWILLNDEDPIEPLSVTQVID